MPVLRFDGVDDKIEFGTIAAPLSNISTGAYTLAVLCRRNTVGAWTSAQTMIASATALGSINVNPQDQLINDLAGGPGASTLLVSSTTEQYILVIGKAAGAATTQYSRYTKSNNTWQHQNSSGTSGNQSAMTLHQIGAWQTGDYFNGWIGVVAAWSGNMSNANRELLSTNWRTSDWWTSPHGQPAELIELNKAATSVTDLAGNASGRTVVGTTLDSAESLASWSFDGIGGTTTQIAGTDGIVLSDISSLGRVENRSATDSSATSESASLAATLSRIDAAALSESVVVSAVAQIGGLDAIAASDSGVLSATEWRAVADSATISDLAALVQGLSTADSALLSELGIVNEVVAKSAFDALVFSATAAVTAPVFVPVVARPTRAAINLWAAVATLRVYAAAASLTERRAAAGVVSRIQGANVTTRDANVTLSDLKTGVTVG